MKPNKLLRWICINETKDHQEGEANVKDVVKTKTIVCVGLLFLFAS